MPLNSGEAGGGFNGYQLQSDADFLAREYPDLRGSVQLLMGLRFSDEIKAERLDWMWGEAYAKRTEDNLGQAAAVAAETSKPKTAPPEAARPDLSRIILPLGALCAGTALAPMLRRVGAGYDLISPDPVQFVKETTSLGFGAALFYGWQKLRRK